MMMTMTSTVMPARHECLPGHHQRLSARHQPALGNGSVRLARSKEIWKEPRELLATIMEVDNQDQVGCLSGHEMHIFQKISTPMLTSMPSAVAGLMRISAI